MWNAGDLGLEHRGVLVECHGVTGELQDIDSDGMTVHLVVSDDDGQHHVLACRACDQVEVSFPVMALQFDRSDSCREQVQSMVSSLSTDLTSSPP